MADVVSTFEDLTPEEWQRERQKIHPLAAELRENAMALGIDPADGAEIILVGIEAAFARDEYPLGADAELVERLYAAAFVFLGIE